MKDNLKKYVNKLRSSNLRPTKQRLKICQFLFDREKTFHFTVEDLHNYFSTKDSKKNISLATLYNTVHSFKNAGHLKEIHVNNERSYFDTNASQHHHFFDEDSNKVIDINNDLINLEKFPKPPKGKFIKEIEVTIKLKDIQKK